MAFSYSSSAVAYIFFHDEQYHAYALGPSICCSGTVALKCAAEDFVKIGVWSTVETGDKFEIATTDRR